jgi:hypothetical protein
MDDDEKVGVVIDDGVCGEVPDNGDAACESPNAAIRSASLTLPATSAILCDALAVLVEVEVAQSFSPFSWFVSLDQDVFMVDVAADEGVLNSSKGFSSITSLL